MDETTLKNLKLALRESDSPFFSDEDLTFYYEQNNCDFNRTVYRCAMLKAEDDSIALPGGLSLPNNREYWLRLARMYRKNGSCNL